MPEEAATPLSLLWDDWGVGLGDNQGKSYVHISEGGGEFRISEDSEWFWMKNPFLVKNK